MEEHQKGEKFTLVDPASTPERPVSPNRLLIILAGFIVSLGSGLGAVALVETLDHSVRSPEELGWLTRLPVLGTISLIQTAEDLAREIFRRRLIWSITGVSIVLGVVLFHFFYMDIWILAAKIHRVIDKYT